MRRVVTVSLAAFVVLGMPDGALGVAWPSIRHDLGLPLSALGLLLLASLAGFLLVSSPSGRLARRFGTRQLLLAATGVGALGLAIVGVSPGLASLVLASFLIGLAAGGIDPGINAYMALRHGAGLMNLLHAAYGVGAVLGPLLVTALIARQLSWRWAYAVLAAAYLGMVLVTCITSGWRPLADPGEVPGRTPLASPTLWLAAATFFFCTGLEVGAGAWSFSLLTQSRGLPAAVAGLLVAGYWAAFTGARMLAAVASARFGPGGLLRLSLWLTVGATAAFWWTPFALPLVGFGVAAIFPALVSLTPSRLRRAGTPSAVGYQHAAAVLGGAVIPALAGVLFQSSTIELLGPLLFGLALVVVALDLLLGRSSSALKG